MAERSTTDLHRLVRRWTRSISPRERRAASEALDSLIGEGARRELQQIVDDWTHSVSEHEQRAAARARKALEE
jgi:hypothetical protein